ncbi:MULTISPECIES: calcium-binding protein [unclassified Microcoleus]|uniref:calcium-binding protein n=1 Tax=unclassified Microcoleus TaxID=2642155 RepID=UPI002FD2BBC4
MNYDIFDEPYYLAQYPWVKPAIDAGIIKSGREHFEKFGQAAGLTKVSRYFDEETYLAQNPDIAPFVRTPNNPNAPFASGVDQFIQFGYEEGRTRVSPEYNEDFYLANNQEVLPFVQNGTFKNGYQHFIKFGNKEGRFATFFWERNYLINNPDIAPFVNSGALKTGREHYFKFGQFEQGRSATFVGSPGNDILTGVGVGNVRLIGVEVDYRVSESDGSNEFDTLIGGTGRDTFVLGETILSRRLSIVDVKTFYIGQGFATIRNFTQGQDTIELRGSFLDDYILVPTNNNRDLAIQRKGKPFDQNGVNQTSPGDTIAVIEGGGNLKLNLLPESHFLEPLLG